MSIPVLDHTGWRHLLRALSAASPCRWLTRYTQEELAQGLVVPVGIARWIARFAPELIGQDTLNLVIAGAEQGADAVAGGRWYHLLPYLLGNPALRVEVTLVGPHARGTTGKKMAWGDHIEPAWAGMPLTWLPAAVRVQTIGAYTRDTGLKDVDLVVLTHPGLESYRESWLAEGELAAVLATSVRVAGLSYAADEYEMERWILAAHGYSTAAHSELNPFALQAAKDVGFPVAIAHTLWQLTTAPVAGQSPDAAMLATFDEFDERAKQWLARGQGEFLANMGSLLTREQGSPFVYIPPVFAADLASGEVHIVSDEAEPEIVVLSEELLASRPSLADLPFARSAWALKVADYLLAQAAT